MRKFIIILMLAVAFSLGVREFVSGGHLFRIALENPDSRWSGLSLHYLAEIYLLFQSPGKASEVNEIIIENFEETPYYERAFYRRYFIAYKHGSRQQVIESGEDYLNKFPRGEKAGGVRRRLDLLAEF